MKGKIKYIVCVLLIAALFSTTVSAAPLVYAFDGAYWQTVAAGTNSYRVINSVGNTSGNGLTIDDGQISLAGQSYNYVSLEFTNLSAGGKLSALGFQYNLAYEIPLALDGSESVSLDMLITTLNLGSSLQNLEFSVVYTDSSGTRTTLPDSQFSIGSAFSASDLGGGVYARQIDIELGTLDVQTLYLYFDVPDFSYRTMQLVFLYTSSGGGGGGGEETTSQEILDKVTEIGEYLKEVYESRPGDDEDMAAIESGMSDVGDKLESAGEILGDVETVNPDDLPIGFEDVVGDNFIYDDVSGFFSVLMGPTFVTMATIVLSLGLISYIMFGKKG